MPDVVDEFVGQRGGGEAFRAVARPAEGDHQGRGVRLEEVERAGDDVGRRHGLDAATQVATKGGRRDLAEERRAARAGQDDPDIGTADHLAQEPGHRLVVATRDLAPDVGLLADLENRCAAVFLGGRGYRHSATPVKARALAEAARQARE